MQVVNMHPAYFVKFPALAFGWRHWATVHESFGMTVREIFTLWWYAFIMCKHGFNKISLYSLKHDFSQSFQHSECTVMRLLCRAHHKNHSNLYGSHLKCIRAALKWESRGEYYIERREGQFRTGGFWKWDVGEDQRGKETRSSHPAGKKRWRWPSFATALLPPCLPPCPPSVFRQTLQRRERRISALRSTFIPPTLSPPLCVWVLLHLRSEMLCSAAHWGNHHQLFIIHPAPEHERQELLHHLALTGGKSQRRVAAAQWKRSKG